VTPPRSGPSALASSHPRPFCRRHRGRLDRRRGFLAAGPGLPRPALPERRRTCPLSHRRRDPGAAGFWIDANDLRFTGVASPTLASDAVSLTDWTLEVSWTEQGREQRLSCTSRPTGVVEDPRGPGLRLAAVRARTVRPSPRARTRRRRWVPCSMATSTWREPPPPGPCACARRLRIAVGPTTRSPSPSSRRIGSGRTPTGVTQQPFEARGRILHGKLHWRPTGGGGPSPDPRYRLSLALEYSTGTNTGYAEAHERARDQADLAHGVARRRADRVSWRTRPTRPAGRPARLPADCPTPPP